MQNDRRIKVFWEEIKTGEQDIDFRLQKAFSVLISEDEILDYFRKEKER